MQKIKNMLHHNNNEATTTNTASHPTTYDSLDRNKDGRVDAADFPGKGTSTTHHNPLDRNHDGKVNLKDLKPSAKREAPINDQKLAALDRNHDGVVDARDFQGQQGMGLAQRNPLDRNGDGRVDARDFQGQQGGLVHRNPLDRNGDGRVDARDFQSQQVGLATVRAEPAVVQVVEKDVVVHEHIHTLEKEEIQPIIHREREQLDIKQVTQQLHETQIQPTLIQHRELAAEFRAPIIERGAPIQENVVLPSVDRDATIRSTQINAPIIEETIKKTIIEEIQPVLERDIIQSTIIQERKDIYEKIVEAPVVYRETRVIQDRGINGGSLEALAAQGFNMGTYHQGGMNPLDRNGDGRVDARDFQQGGLMSQRTANPLDRNHDGRVDLKDLTGQPGYNQQGIAQPGMMGQRTANPLDRNNDGRMDLKDLTGKPAYNQQNMMAPKTSNPLDRNNDGKVDIRDISSVNSQQAPLRTI
jgi:hypothetical protein